VKRWSLIYYTESTIGGREMPTYEYVCESCNHEFSVVQSISQKEREKVTCPSCKSDKTKQIPSSFTAKTSKKS
jgi:putative FmdB family regulatory protein